MPVIPALRRLRQEISSLGYLARPCLKKQNNKNASCLKKKKIFLRAFCSVAQAGLKLLGSVNPPRGQGILL
jgi:hypothetical protein